MRALGWRRHFGTGWLAGVFAFFFAVKKRSDREMRLACSLFRNKNI